MNIIKLLHSCASTCTNINNCKDNKGDVQLYTRIIEKISV